MDFDEDPTNILIKNYDNSDQEDMPCEDEISGTPKIEIVGCIDKSF